MGARGEGVHSATIGLPVRETGNCDVASSIPVLRERADGATDSICAVFRGHDALNGDLVECGTVWE